MEPKSLKTEITPDMEIVLRKAFNDLQAMSPGVPVHLVVRKEGQNGAEFYPFSERSNPRIVRIIDTDYAEIGGAYENYAAVEVKLTQLKQAELKPFIRNDGHLKCNKCKSKSLPSNSKFADNEGWCHVCDESLAIRWNCVRIWDSCVGISSGGSLSTIQKVATLELVI